MKKTLFSLVALLLPLTMSAQLISVETGTGRTETKKEKKDKKTHEPQTPVKPLTPETPVTPITPETPATPVTSETYETSETPLTLQMLKDLETEMAERLPEESSRKLKATVSADIVSHYYWRGQDLAGFSLQPTASLSWRGLSLKICSSNELEKNGYTDIDLTLGYKLGPFNIGVTDYWSSGMDAEDRYFYYGKDGGHYLDGNIGFTCKYFSLQGYCCFWGNDFKITDNSQAYSTYIELSVPFRLSGLDFLVTAGGTPMESGGWWETATRQTILGERDVNIKTYQYADGPACCLASLRCTKNLQFKDLSLPVFAEFTANPYLSKAAFIFGVTIAPF